MPELLSALRAFLGEVSPVLLAIDLPAHRDREGVVAVLARCALRSELVLAIVAELWRVFPISMRPDVRAAVFVRRVVPFGVVFRFALLAEAFAHQNRIGAC